MPKKGTSKAKVEPKQEHPTFLEGILPDSISATIDKWLPDRSERQYKGSIDDYMFWAMVGSLYYFQWKAQKILIDRWVEDYGDGDIAVQQILDLIATVESDIEKVKQEIKDRATHLERAKVELKAALVKRDGPPEGGADQKTWYAYWTKVIEGLSGTIERLTKEISEWRTKLNALEKQRLDLYLKKAQILGELKKAGKCPEMDYITPLFSSMALAYLLKHSEGYGSAAVVGVVLGIIGSPLLAASDTYIEVKDHMNENPWLYALGPGGFVIDYARQNGLEELGKLIKGE
jgi:hypothetical protein